MPICNRNYYAGLCDAGNVDVVDEARLRPAESHSGARIACRRDGVMAIARTELDDGRFTICAPVGL